MYLNDRNGYNVIFRFPSEYILPYEKEVAPQYEKAKKFCNWCVKPMAYSLASLFIISLIKYFANHVPNVV